MNNVRTNSLITLLLLYATSIGLQYGECYAQPGDYDQKKDSSNVESVSFGIGSGFVGYNLTNVNEYLNAFTENGQKLSTEHNSIPFFIDLGVRVAGNIWIGAEVSGLRRDRTLTAVIPIATTSPSNPTTINFDSDITSSSATFVSLGGKYQHQWTNLYYFFRADVGLVFGHLKYEMRSLPQTPSTIIDYGGNSTGFNFGGGVGYRIFSWAAIEGEIGYRYARLSKLKDGDKILQYSIDQGAIVLLEAKDERSGFKKMGLDFSGWHLRCSLRFSLQTKMN
jgi:hypothetical protein